MMIEWLAQIESTPLIVALRNSTWVYPLINAGHILGIALLIGGILPLDLRLLGLWRSMPLKPLWQLLSRSAAIGLGIAVLCGSLLFISDAREYLKSGLFLGKMLIVLTGVSNAVILHIAASRYIHNLPADILPAPTPLRIAATISLLSWPAALVLGRLVGYF